MTAAPALVGQMPPVFVALAGSVRPDWVRIDAIWERLAREHGSHLRRQSGLEPRRFLAEAFAAARDLDILRAFAIQLVKEDLVAGPDVGGFNEKVEEVVGRSIYGQQSWVNGVFGAVDARLAGRGLLRACDYVCRIDVDGEQVGTGVLVGPVLVATAAHVVLPLTARGADGKPEVAADGTLRAASRLAAPVDADLRRRARRESRTAATRLGRPAPSPGCTPTGSTGPAPPRCSNRPPRCSTCATSPASRFPTARGTSR